MRALSWAVGLLPYRCLAPLGAALGLLAGSVLRIRRRHVEGSMRRAGVRAAARSARAMYASLGAGLFELLWLAGRPRTAARDQITMAPAVGEALRAAARLGRGVVVATAHTGNWDLTAVGAAEWMAAEAGGLPPLLYVVTKRLSWRALDRYWQRLRAARGVVLVGAEGAAASVGKALGEGAAVALLVDQVPERARGSLVHPFLGAPAKHDAVPALMAARHRVPLVLVMGRRLASGQHVAELGLTVSPAELRKKGGVDEATRRVAEAVERFVVEHPDQWLWLHRRWKGVD